MVDLGPERRSEPAIPHQQEVNFAVRLLASSRYFAAFAVLGTFLAAVSLYVYGTLVVIQLILEAFWKYKIETTGEQHLHNVQQLQVAFIEMTDVFLLGTVLLIVAFGLYQLFIQPELPLPAWLKIQNLDQLTERLIEVVGVLLSVTFLAYAVGRILEHEDEVNLLELGASVAIVIAALSLLLVVSHRRSGEQGTPQSEG